MIPFEIKGRDIKKRNVGTTEKPHLYAITAGQRNAGTGGSLIFHVKIGDTFHQLTICKTHKNSVAVICIKTEVVAKRDTSSNFSRDSSKQKLVVSNWRTAGPETYFTLISPIQKFEKWTTGKCLAIRPPVIPTNVRPRIGTQSEKTSASSTQRRPWPQWKVSISRRSEILV